MWQYVPTPVGRGTYCYIQRYAFPDASDKNQTQSHCYHVNDCQKTNFVSKRRYAFHVLKMNAYLLLLTNYDLLVKGGTHFFATKKVTHVSKNAYLLLLVKTYFCNHLHDNNENCISWIQSSLLKMRTSENRTTVIRSSQEPGLLYSENNKFTLQFQDNVFFFAPVFFQEFLRRKKCFTSFNKIPRRGFLLAARCQISCSHVTFGFL